MTSTRTHELSANGDGPSRFRPSRTWLAVGLFVLGAGAAAVSLLGPLVGKVIRYHASEGAVNQIIGGDVAGLVLVVPVSILAGILVWRGHLAGPVMALGPALYALYMYSQLAVGGDFVRYPGNSERFFPLYLGLFLVAGAIAIRAWSMIDVGRLPATGLWVDRTVGIFFLVVAFFLAFGLHLPGLVDAWSTDPTRTEYLADPVVFWLVKFMDLGLVVPGLVAVGIGVLRGKRWADKAKYGAIAWSALLGASVAGMAIVMQATADPAATVANIVAFSSFAVIGLALATVVYRPLVRHSWRSPLGFSLTPSQEATEPAEGTRFGIYLYWLPLGAGGVGYVRFNGRIYEAIKARFEGRRPLDLYHTALEIRLPEGRFIVENAWPSPDTDIASRGVALDGPVFSRRLARFRPFRYEVRCWRDGTIPDADEAVDVQLLSGDADRAQRVLDLVATVPVLVWGRDQLGVGEMWNSNSVISYLLARTGADAESRPPAGGRAPGWEAGILAAQSPQVDVMVWTSRKRDSTNSDSPG